jgi:hypothetical protein
VAIALVVLGCLAAVTPVQAQSFSTADLEGTWQVFQLATPRGVLTGADVRSYGGEVSFDATGVVTGVSVLADDALHSYTVSGNLSVTTGGVINGTLLLTGIEPGTPSGALVVREARLLTSRFTMVGAATVLDQVGLFTFVKRDNTQTFTFTDDLAGDWDYHELTPSTNAVNAGDAAWTNGSITFHGDSGCTEADLDRSDGTARARRSDGPVSFG